MTLYVVMYDQRATYYDYSPLYRLLQGWNAAQLQNSVWLVDFDGTAEDVNKAMAPHFDHRDKVAVIELSASGADWAAYQCRPEGMAWLKARFPLKVTPTDRAN